MKKLILILAGIMLLAGCNPPNTAQPTPINTVAAADQPVEALPPTATEQAALPTNTPEPTATFTPEPTAAPTNTPLPAVYGPDSMPAEINPLTGQLPAAPELLNRRPIAVKINLVPRSYYRPPFGLSQADIVYDYYHNGGYSRLHAIFYGNDAELVGPVRSGRLLDTDLVRMYKSIFAYGSADQVINDRLFSAEFYERLVLERTRSECPPIAENPLCRYDEGGYDYLLGSTTAISQHIANKGIENGRQDLKGMTFSAQVPPNGQPATQAFVRYSTDDYVRWDYDSASGRYHRFQDNKQDTGEGEEYAPLVDRLNNQQIFAENVVVVFARHEYYQQPPAEIFDILLSGNGMAYALRDGQLYQVTWNRPNINSVLYLTYADGTPFTFKPGITWVQVVGIGSTVTQDNASWRFQFMIP